MTLREDEPFGDKSLCLAFVHFARWRPSNKAALFYCGHWAALQEQLGIKSLAQVQLSSTAVRCIRARPEALTVPLCWLHAALSVFHWEDLENANER